jgi:hypothetical protein
MLLLEGESKAREHKPHLLVSLRIDCSSHFEKATMLCKFFLRKLTSPLPTQRYLFHPHASTTWFSVFRYLSYLLGDDCVHYLNPHDNPRTR